MCAIVKQAPFLRMCACRLLDICSNQLPPAIHVSEAIGETTGLHNVDTHLAGHSALCAFLVSSAPVPAAGSCKRS